MIAREFFADPSHSADSLANTSKAAQDEGFTEADHTLDDGGDFDGGFEV